MRTGRLPVVCALAYGAAVFLPMLSHSFYRDDFGWVGRALEAGSDPRSWPFLAGTDFRPVASLSFVLNLALGGLDPAGYYAFNLLLHLANVLLLMALARRLGAGRLAVAGIAGILFAGAVGNFGEAVNWICGRTGLFAGFFMLAASVTHWDWRTHGRTRDRVLSLAAFALALLSKETASVLLPLLVALDRVQAGRNPRPCGPRPAVAFAPHAAMLAAYLVFQFAVWRQGSPIVGGEYRLGWHGLVNLDEYLVRMFVPVTPTSMLVAVPPAVLPVLRALLAGLGLAVPLGLVVLLAGRASREAKFAALWIPLTLLPVVFFTYRTSTRYLYVPSMGLAILLGLAGAAGWAHLRSRGAPWRRTLAAGALVAVLVAQAAVLQVVLHRRATLEQAEGGPGWERLRAVARSSPSSDPEVP